MDPFNFAFGWGPRAFPTPSGITRVTTTGSSPIVVVAASLSQVLYLQEGSNSAVISVTDVHQGQMGDCYLCTSIGELALFHSSWITNMIHSNADGSETVTLYRASNGSLPTFGTTAFTAVSINITNSFPSNSANCGATQDVYNGQKEIWVQVLEKAVATLYGGYNGIANGGDPAITMEELTGCAATYMSPGSLSLQQLQAASAAGDLIAFDTQGSGVGAYGLYREPRLHVREPEHGQRHSHGQPAEPMGVR